jgi:uncharacterized protein involved in exopolysaccharide biosynthesis
MASKTSIAKREERERQVLEARLEAMEKSIASLKRELSKLKKTEQDK